jgi:hypothetical protein
MTRNTRLLAARVIPTAFASCARPFMWVVPIFGIDPLSGRCGSVLQARSRSSLALAGILAGTSPCNSITPEEEESQWQTRTAQCPTRPMNGLGPRPHSAAALTWNLCRREPATSIHDRFQVIQQRGPRAHSIADLDSRESAESSVGESS